MYQKCGTENRVKFVDISRMAQVLGHPVCKALPSLHAFTGCDSISAFAGKGKLSALKLLKLNDSYQEMFKEIGTDWVISDLLLQQIEAFTCKLYGLKNDTVDINQARYQLFCSITSMFGQFDEACPTSLLSICCMEAKFIM